MTADRTGTEDPERATAGRSRMLARTWAIAANYRSPADYGIPTAPSLRAEYRSDGDLVLLAPNCEESVLVAETPVEVRR